MVVLGRVGARKGARGCGEAVIVGLMDGWIGGLAASGGMQARGCSRVFVGVKRREALKPQARGQKGGAYKFGVGQGRIWRA